MGTKDTASWIAAQVAAGEQMGSLWDPMLVRAWQENNAAARSQLAALSVAQVATFAAGGHTSVDVMVQIWQQECPSELAALRQVLPEGPHSEDTALTQSDRDLLERLWSLAADRGLQPLALMAEAVTSTNLASMLAKNPTKQNPYEPAAVAYLQAATRAGQPGSPVAGVVQLSRVGIGIRFRPDGDWFVSTRQDRASKSADIAILVLSDDGKRGRWYLCAHKYARVPGGHQDNQRQDALGFADYALRGHDNGLMLDPLNDLLKQLAPNVEDIDWRPGLILDGAYFARGLDQLRTGSPDPLLFVGDSDQWAAWLLSPAAAC